MGKSFFLIGFIDKEKTINELLKESRDGNEYYFLLTIATFIATLGLIIDNPFVILGGMLISPILFPILSLAMGVVTSSRLAITRAIKISSKSTLLILIVSSITAYFFGTEEVSGEVLMRIEPNLILFLISFAAGLAISYSWVKQELSAVLPGIAVAESILPPLAVIGMGIALADKAIIMGSLTLFAINLFGVIFSSILIFSLFGFSYLQTEEEDDILEEQMEKQVQEQALDEAKLAERVQEASEAPV